MVIKDEAILVSKLKYGETSLILSLLTKEYGLQKGLFKGALSKKNKIMLEVGTILSIEKKARTEEQLGFLKIEPKENYLKNIFYDSSKLLTLSTICSLINDFITEKEADSNFYETTKSLIILLEKENSLSIYTKWELLLLDKIGSGLDLSKCALTGCVENLYFISPRTGKSVTQEAGFAFKDKLFTIPKCFTEDMPTEDKISYFQDIQNALHITSHFLSKFSTEYNKRIPISRNMLISYVKKNLYA